MIVPDSIDPYIGYKALRIDAQGLLASPTYQVGWPPGTRMEATCHMQGWNWTLAEGTPPPTMHYGPPLTPYHHGYDPRYYQTTSFNSTRGSVIFPGPKPDFEPPEGTYWDWQMIEHTPANEHCTCGIYAVSNVALTAGYLQPDCVICEITMWGQVTIGVQGARGQYAYPTKIYVPAHLKEHAITVAATYETEWVPQTFTVGRRGGDLVSIPLRNEQHDARIAASFFLAMTSLMLALSAIINLLTSGIWPTLIPNVLAGIFLILFTVAFRDSRKTTA